MLFGSHDETCACGHSTRLHDRFGCAAFLAAFEATAHELRYCACKRERPGDLRTAPPSRADVVATVTLRERRGSAIAVCESPPALELGPSADAVLAAMKTKLRTTIGPRERRAERLRVIRRGTDGAVESIELLG